MDMISLFLYFLFNFFLYGFIGWIIENLFSYFVKGHFQEDGFLNGPFKPMYAIAMTIIIALYRIYSNTYYLIFIGIVIPTTVEYITGVAMCKYFNKKYWDYSEVKWNYQGIVCAIFSIYWTILTFIGVRYLQPYIADNLYRIIMPVWPMIALVLLVLLMVDEFFTLRDFKSKDKLA